MTGSIDVTDPVLCNMVDRLVPVYHPLKIYLFGSRARGNSRPDSDYDLLLLVSNDAPEEFRTAGKAYSALWGVQVPVDVLVWTQRDFENSLDLRNSLPSEVMREGKVLHVA